MLFDWNEYLELARHLCPPKKTFLSVQDEAKYRSSVSRSYYAAFNAATDLAMKKFKYVRPPGNASHQDLIDFYADRYTCTKEKAFSVISASLDEMKTHRKIADYRANQKVGFDEADYCIYMAEDVFTNIGYLN